MTVHLDYIANAGVRHDAQGVTVTRKGRISEIGGTVVGRSRAALHAPGLPRYGDTHPDWPDLRVVDVVLVPIDTKQWDVTIIYREPGPEQLAHMEPIGRVIDVQWFASNVTVERSLDANGERMVHVYSGWPEVPTVIAGRQTFRRSTALVTAWKAETAEIQLPAVGVRVLIAESRDPSSRLDYVSKVNGGYWSGYAPGTWLFVGPISGVLERGRWLNTYELLHRPDTWRLHSVVEVYGAPASNATEGNGIRSFDVFADANFGQIGFTL